MSAKKRLTRLPTDGVHFLPKQAEFLTSQADETLYSGAFGAGKSYALCWWVVLRAQRPGARVGLFRLNLQRLYESTLVTLLEGDGITPPVLEPGTYRHNKTRRV